ncbi:MAG: hypothetical protein ACYC8T_22920 [Myxococcaceae bacterium]
MTFTLPWTSEEWFARSFDDGLTWNRPYLKRMGNLGYRVGHLALAVGGRAAISLLWQDDAGANPRIRASTTEGDFTASFPLPANLASRNQSEWIYRAYSPHPGSGLAAQVYSADLYASLTDGTRLTRLTRDGRANLAHPGLSPDGRFVAYGHHTGGLHVAEADGAHPMVVAFEMDGVFPNDAWWSPTGARILFSVYAPPTTSEEPNGFNSVSVLGTGRVGTGSYLGLQPWSPTDQLAPPSLRDAAWSPSGAQLAAVNATTLHGFGTLSVLNPDLTGKVDLTTGADARTPAWSPDGTTLAFVSNRDGNQAIYFTTPTGAPDSETRFSFGAGQDSQPVFLTQGDGLIVRTRDAAGAGLLRRLAVPGGTSTALTPATGNVGPAAVLFADGIDLSRSVIVQGAAVDASGNVYVTGYFSGGARFGALPVLTRGSPLNGIDAFLAKMSPSGTWLWAKRMGGDMTALARAVALDGTGNVYVAGRLTGTVAFDGLNVITTGYSSCFVGKADPAGVWQWVSQAAGSCDDLAVDFAGNSYIAGTAAAPFSSGAPVVKNVGRFQVGKLDPAGAWLWINSATKGSGSKLSWEQAIGVACDGSGNVLATGSFYADIPFLTTGGTVTLTNPSFKQEAWVAKANASGDWLWAAAVQGRNGFPSDLAVDAAGDAYVAGRHGFLDALGLSIVSPRVFAAKFSSGGALAWSVTTTGLGVGTESAHRVVAKGGAVYFAGDLGRGGVAAVNFGTFPLTSAGGGDAFLARVDPSTGAWQWAIRGGSAGDDASTGLDLDPSGTPIVAGLIGGRALFGPYPVAAQYGSDAFVGKASAAGAWQSAWGTR